MGSLMLTVRDWLAQFATIWVIILPKSLHPMDMNLSLQSPVMAAVSYSLCLGCWGWVGLKSMCCVHQSSALSTCCIAPDYFATIGP